MSPDIITLEVTFILEIDTNQADLIDEWDFDCVLDRPGVTVCDMDARRITPEPQEIN